LSRLTVLVCDIVLLAIPCALLAQRAGRGAGAGRPPAAPSDPAPNSDMKDFSRAIALQATSDQAARFQQLTKSTEAARKKARDLVQLMENTNKPDSFHYSALNDAVEEARNDNRQFVGSFSTPQQSGLKPLVKKLGKADADLSKQSNALTQELGRPQINDKKIADVVGKLDKALTAFQTEQLAIGKEMGIQPEERSQ
jgi:hypothetical protein